MANWVISRVDDGANNLNFVQIGDSLCLMNWFHKYYASRATWTLTSPENLLTIASTRAFKDLRELLSNKVLSSVLHQSLISLSAASFSAKVFPSVRRL